MAFGSKDDEKAEASRLATIQQKEAIAAILGDVGGTMVDSAQVSVGSQAVKDARPPCQRCCNYG